MAKKMALSTREKAKAKSKKPVSNAKEKTVSAPKIKPIESKPRQQKKEEDIGEYTGTVLLDFNIDRLQEYKPDNFYMPVKEIDTLYEYSLKQWKDYTDSGTRVEWQYEYKHPHVHTKELIVLRNWHWVEIAKRLNDYFAKHNIKTRIETLKCYPVDDRLKEDEERERYFYWELHTQIHLPPKMRYEIAKRIMKIEKTLAKARKERMLRQNQGKTAGTEVPLGKPGRATDALNRIISRNNYNKVDAIATKSPEIYSQWHAEGSFAELYALYEQETGNLRPAHHDDVISFMKFASKNAEIMMNIIMRMDIERFRQTYNNPEQRNMLIDLQRNLEGISKRGSARVEDLAHVNQYEID